MVSVSDFSLHYNWHALSEVEQAIGMEKLLNIAIATPLEVAKAFAIGCKKNHPEYTLEKVLELSIPFAHAMKAVDKALLFAYVGHDNPEAGEADKKK